MGHEANEKYSYGDISGSLILDNIEEEG